MLDRFDDRSGGVVEVARLQARDLDHNYVGTEHLLLALTAEDFGPATRVLAAAGITPAAIRSEVIEELGGEDGDLTEADAEALATLGIDLHQVRRRVEDAFGHLALSTSHRCEKTVWRTTAIPLTPRSKKALQLSVGEAKRLGDASVSPEHLLLALLNDEKALAVKLIRRLGAAPRVLRTRTIEAIGSS